MTLETLVGALRSQEQSVHEQDHTHEGETMNPLTAFAGSTARTDAPRDAPVLSERTRRAVQDYTALNTITTATERLYAGTFTAFDVDLLEATRACPDGWRVRLACPLGRRMRSVGLLRPDRRRAR